MFAVIYKSYIHPEYEDEYLKLWEVIARYYVGNCGALGSTLHKTDEGQYIAYSRWPDKQTRDANWGDNRRDLPSEIEKTIQHIKNCIDDTKPHDEICMKVVNDLLLEK